MDDVIQMKMEQVKKKNEAFMQLLQNIFVHHKKIFLNPPKNYKTI